MKTKLYLILSIVCIVSSANKIQAQGCVAVRNMASCSLDFDSTQNSSWQFSLNYRYFHSFRHFRGKEEEANRVEEGTEVINNDNSILAGISYAANNRWSFGLTVPYLIIDRSSLYEHLRKHTQHESKIPYARGRVWRYAPIRLLCSGSQR